MSHILLDVLYDGLLRKSPGATVPGGLVAAAVLFWLRGFRPVWYGYLEIFVGVLALASGGRSIDVDDVPTVIPFIGGIYIVIRGLDNVTKAMTIDTDLKRVVAWLFSIPPKK